MKNTHLKQSLVFPGHRVYLIMSLYVSPSFFWLTQTNKHTGTDTDRQSLFIYCIQAIII